MLFLINLLSFFLPTQLSYNIDFLSSTVYGFNIDYLSPTLFFTDLIAILIIIFGLKVKKIDRKFLLMIILYLLFAFFNIKYSLQPIASVYKWLRLTEMILLGVTLHNYKKFDVYKNFVLPLSFSMLGVCILGILQFINKGSLGGLFYFFGERAFTFYNPNIAPYPYSTFSHPNSFAGFLLVFVLFLIKYKNRFNIKYYWTILSLSLINILLTNSLNVYLVSGLLLLLFIKSKYLNAFVFVQEIHNLTSQRFVTHRIELIKASFTMIKDNFFTGVGLNNFIPNLVKVSNTFINSWELQPVHNIFLLVFSELGVIGLVSFLILIFSGTSLSSYPLLAIIFTGMSDHYWLTLQQNMLLFTYVLVAQRKK